MSDGDEAGGVVVSGGAHVRGGCLCGREQWAGGDKSVRSKSEAANSIRKKEGGKHK